MDADDELSRALPAAEGDVERSFTSAAAAGEDELQHAAVASQAADSSNERKRNDSDGYLEEENLRQASLTLASAPSQSLDTPLPCASGANVPRGRISVLEAQLQRLTTAMPTEDNASQGAQNAGTPRGRVTALEQQIERLLLALEVRRRASQASAATNAEAVESPEAEDEQEEEEEEKEEDKEEDDQLRNAEAAIDESIEQRSESGAKYGDEMHIKDNGNEHDVGIAKEAAEDEQTKDQENVSSHRNSLDDPKVMQLLGDIDQRARVGRSYANSLKKHGLVVKGFTCDPDEVLGGRVHVGGGYFVVGIRADSKAAVLDELWQRFEWRPTDAYADTMPIFRGILDLDLVKFLLATDGVEFVEADVNPDGSVAFVASSDRDLLSKASLDAVSASGGKQDELTLPWDEKTDEDDESDMLGMLFGKRISTDATFLDEQVMHEDDGVMEEGVPKEHEASDDNVASIPAVVTFKMILRGLSRAKMEKLGRHEASQLRTVEDAVATALETVAGVQPESAKVSVSRDFEVKATLRVPEGKMVAEALLGTSQISKEVGDRVAAIRRVGAISDGAISVEDVQTVILEEPDSAENGEIGSFASSPARPEQFPSISPSPSVLPQNRDIGKPALDGGASRSRMPKPLLIALEADDVLAEPYSKRFPDATAGNFHPAPRVSGVRAREHEQRSLRRLKEAERQLDADSQNAQAILDDEIADLLMELGAQPALNGATVARQSPDTARPALGLLPRQVRGEKVRKFYVNLHSEIDGHSRTKPLR